MVEVPLEEFGLAENEAFEVEDLLTGDVFRWQGRRNYIRLLPWEKAGHVLRLRR
jgi:starch synthase (maltosyl-transferring)